jgi:hypothetical protein
MYLSINFETTKMYARYTTTEYKEQYTRCSNVCKLNLMSEWVIVD